MHGHEPFRFLENEKELKEEREFSLIKELFNWIKQAQTQNSTKQNLNNSGVTQTNSTNRPDRT